MTDLLKRIDPDGMAFIAFAAAYANDHRGRYPDPGHRRYLADAVRVLAERGLLRDPAEPTLAEIREKVEALPTLHGLVLCGPSADGTARTEIMRRDDECVRRTDVLALLEPKKPEPTQLIPWRELCNVYGLPEDEARKCARIISDFHTRWNAREPLQNESRNAGVPTSWGTTLDLSGKTYENSLDVNRHVANGDCK